MSVVFKIKKTESSICTHTFTISGDFHYFLKIQFVTISLSVWKTSLGHFQSGGPPARSSLRLRCLCWRGLRPGCGLEPPAAACPAIRHALSLLRPLVASMSSVSQQLDCDVSGSHFLEFVLSCVLWASGSINLCLLLNLGNCQPWFLHSFPSLCISSLPSWDSSCRVPDIIPSFDIIPQVPEALFIFIPNLFLCFSDWMLCLSVLKFTESSVNSKLLLPFIQWIF